MGVTFFLIVDYVRGGDCICFKSGLSVCAWDWVRGGVFLKSASNTAVFLNAVMSAWVLKFEKKCEYISK